MTGKAYLVGAGPGRPDLITVRGLHLLRRAEVLIYDHLIARELLNEAPTNAERIFVGKAAGVHTLEQDAINQLLVLHVQAGRQVVRLKGGDPCVFGRGGEEALALVEAGLPFEIVPGVSSALAVPTYAGIPVTQRGIATSFAVVTGHEAAHTLTSTTDWDALARMPTLIVLMGVQWIETICTALIAAGRDPATPAAAISRGTMTHQHVLHATLQTLPARIAAEQVRAPAVIVIGKVVDLAHQLAWFQPDSAASEFVSMPE